MKIFRRPLFWAIFGIPNLACLLYFGLIASPVYVSTASLIVYKPSQGSGNIVSMLSGAGGSTSTDGAYILKNYIGSWDEYHNVGVSFDLHRIFAEGDFVSRYGGLSTLFHQNDVSLWHYFQDKVNASIDQNSGIVSLDVQSYSPDAAARIAEKVLYDSVQHIDAMNAQQESDYIHNAVQRRVEVEAKLQTDEAALAAYRVTTGVHDPSELYTSNLALLNQLNLQKTRLASQYDSVSQATPNNPVAQNLRSAMAAIQTRITSTEADVKTLSRYAARYEVLTVARDNDVALLHEVDTAVQQAQLNAMKNRYYLNIISAPSRPHAPELPRRLEWIAGVFLATLVLWGLLR